MSRILIGTVVSNAMQKSAVVLVETSKVHPIYKKRYKTSKRFIVHDPENSALLGDQVELNEIRPMSAHKRFQIGKVIKAALVRKTETVETVPQADAKTATQGDAK